MEERRQYNGQMFETLNQISGDIGEIKGALAALTGPEGRVTRIEEDLLTQERRSWVQTAIVVPLVGALHLGAKKLGW
jgi:hypothetical protein